MEGPYTKAGLEKLLELVRKEREKLEAAYTKSETDYNLNAPVCPICQTRSVMGNGRVSMCSTMWSRLKAACDSPEPRVSSFEPMFPPLDGLSIDTYPCIMRCPPIPIPFDGFGEHDIGEVQFDEVTHQSKRFPFRFPWPRKKKAE